VGNYNYSLSYNPEERICHLAKQTAYYFKSFFYSPFHHCSVPSIKAHSPNHAANYHIFGPSGGDFMTGAW